MTARARKPVGAEPARADPDRPLLRLLNRAAGKPVLVMCGLPGDHDAAHAAAGRLPVRFHRFSDVRLYWREFKDGYWRPGQQQRFVALILLTNVEKPIVDAARSASAIMDFHNRGKPILWGEVSPEGVVTWRPWFYIADIATSPEFYLETGWVREEGYYRWVCRSHYKLIPEGA